MLLNILQVCSPPLQLWHDGLNYLDSPALFCGCIQLATLGICCSGIEFRFCGKLNDRCNNPFDSLTLSQHTQCFRCVHTHNVASVIYTHSVWCVNMVCTWIDTFLYSKTHRVHEQKYVIYNCVCCLLLQGRFLVLAIQWESHWLLFDKYMTVT